jgi:N-glycosylase/DNA lyase
MSISPKYFNPELTINSGQMFLWEKRAEAWYGIHTDHVLKLSFNTGPTRNENDSIIYDSFPYNHKWERKLFRLDDDMARILTAISFDSVVLDSILRYQGLRVTRQDPIQCMFSFLCASNTNIQRIRKTLFNLCKRFGKKIIFHGEEFFTFPDARDLSKANISEIVGCGTGYRAKSIKLLAEKLDRDRYDPHELVHMNYEDAKQALLEVYGIGDKTADCILLFSLEKLEAFPIDTWIARMLTYKYELLMREHKLKHYRGMTKINRQQYEIMSNCMRMHFGKYAGYAQQYLYYYSRQIAGRKW